MRRQPSAVAARTKAGPATGLAAGFAFRREPGLGVVRRVVGGVEVELPLGRRVEAQVRLVDDAVGDLRIRVRAHKLTARRVSLLQQLRRLVAVDGVGVQPRAVHRILRAGSCVERAGGCGGYALKSHRIGKGLNGAGKD